MKIEINNKYGKRLKTSKTIIEEDIEVVPVLQNLTITENGTYSAAEGYAGIGEIIVDAAGETVDSWDGTGAVTALVADLVITIGTTIYSILPLMTWYEWVNSEYNTGGFTCSAYDSKVFLGDSQNYLLDSEGVPVYGNTAITTGGTYTISYATTILSSDSAKMVDASGVVLILKED